MTDSDDYSRWNPERYLRYASERGRPFFDLTARITAQDPRLVVDLGCGPGNLTKTLAQRWPEARVLGVDSSAEIIERARTSSDLEYQVADLREWRSPEPVDVLVSNATLQWIPNHLQLLPQLLDQVGADGWFAFQLPHNFDQPNHVLMRELSEQPRYARYLDGVARTSMVPSEDMIAVAAREGFRVDAWETTYFHILDGENPVYDWISGTGLRPTLDRLPAGVREEFIAEYQALLREAYPRQKFGTILPFPRAFLVGQRTG